jgi:integral membrane sensor domain MASE1
MNVQWPETGGSPKPAGLLSPENLALLLCITAIYFFAGRFGLKLAFVHPSLPPIWIPAGIAFAAFILFGYRVWPAVLIGCFLLNVTTSGLVTETFGLPIASTLEGLAGAYLVNRFAGGAKAFDTAQDVFRFAFFACICAPAVGATVGMAAIYPGGRVNLAQCQLLWLTWWLADGIGILLVAPFLILLLRGSHHRLDWSELGELAFLLLALTSLCLIVFGPLSPSLNANRVLQAWLCIPFLIWAAFRFCPLEAAGTMLILFGSAIWGHLHGYCFMARNADPTTSLVLLDTFMGVVGTMTLVVAALVMDRRRIEEELLGLQSLLQEAVQEKDRELVVTIEALKVEIAGHVQTQRALWESRERFRPTETFRVQETIQDREESLE